MAVIHRVNAQLLVLLAALGASTWLFVGISQDVVDHDGIALSDPRLLADVLSHRTSALIVVAQVVTFLGTDVVVYLLLAVVGVLVWRRTRRWQPLFLALAWLGRANWYGWRSTRPSVGPDPRDTCSWSPPAATGFSSA